MSTYISVTDTAKYIRAALKAQFPGVKFSVRSKIYAGGASIRVSWLDGPTLKAVKQITGSFEGAHFDGMIDLKSYVERKFQGEHVHFGSDYVFCDRNYSKDYLLHAAQEVVTDWGLSIDAERFVSLYEYGGLWEFSKTEKGDHQLLGREFHKRLEQTTF